MSSPALTSCVIRSLSTAKQGWFSIHRLCVCVIDDVENDAERKVVTVAALEMLLSLLQTL